MIVKNMVYIYALQLQNNKYYVGKTDNPRFRLDAHFNSNGSAWTKKYNPIRLIDLISECDEFDEDKITLRYMHLHGIDNVRGGSFCREILNESEVKCIDKMLKNAMNKCFNCNQTGHYAKDCKESKALSASSYTTLSTTAVKEQADVPVEYNNVYPFRKLSTFDGGHEYEWRYKNIFTDYDSRHYAINLFTSYAFTENQYLSVAEYLLLIGQLINDPLVIGKGAAVLDTNVTKFGKFISNDPDAHNLQMIDEGKSFFTNKFKLRIIKADAYYCQSYNDTTAKHIKEYVKFFTTATEKVLVARVVFSQKSVILKFIVNK